MPGYVPNKIPRVEQRGNQLDTKSTGTPIDPERASQQGKNMQTVGNAVQDIGQTLSKAYTLAETTRAENFLAKEFARIEAESAQDQNVNADRQKKYHDDLAKVTSEAAGMINLPSARGMFEAQADRAREISKIKVDSIFTKKAIDLGKAELATYLDIAKNRFVSALDPKTRLLAATERDAKIDDMAAVGFLTREAAAEMKVRMSNEWNQSQISYDIETNPVFAYQELQKGDQGFYRDASPEARVEGLAKVDKRIEFLQRKEREDTEDGIMKADAMKMLTADQVEEAALTGRISKTFYNTMKKKFLSAIGPQAETDKVAYANIVNMLLNPATTPAEARIALVNAQAEGKISVDDFKSLYEMHLTPTAAGNASLTQQIGEGAAASDFQKAVAQDQMKKKNLTEKQSSLRSAIGMLTNAAGRNVAQAASMIQDFTQQAIQKKPDEFQGVARKVLSKEMLKARPEIARYPKEGVVLIDANGNRVRVFPDGSYQEV